MINSAPSPSLVHDHFSCCRRGLFPGTAGAPLTATPAASTDVNDAVVSTPYTIDADVHPDVAVIALKHASRSSLARFVAKHPISGHTREAYAEAVKFVREFHLVRQQIMGASQGNENHILKCEQRTEEEIAVAGESGETFSRRKGSEEGYHSLSPKRYSVILDSGCGTGRSSAWLAKCYPHLPVIGVDRSKVRLSKSGRRAQHSLMQRPEEQPRREDAEHNHEKRKGQKFYGRYGASQDGEHEPDTPGGERSSRYISSATGEENVDKKSKIGERTDGEGGVSVGGGADPNTHRDFRDTPPPPTNLLLLRADLVDFWILASRDDAWTVEEHAILYPNPYPKRTQVLRRWHGHPVFPLLLGLGGKITLRSNWKAYLEEVCQAVLAIDAGAQGGAKASRVAMKDSAGVVVDSGSNIGEARTTAIVAGPYFVGGQSEYDAAGREAARDGMPKTGEGDGMTEQNANSEKTSRPHGPVSPAVAAAVAAYADSARAGPVPYFPTLFVTNFEEKFTAAGELVYELVLEPRAQIA